MSDICKQIIRIAHDNRMYVEINIHVIRLILLDRVTFRHIPSIGLFHIIRSLVVLISDYVTRSHELGYHGLSKARRHNKSAKPFGYPNDIRKLFKISGRTFSDLRARVYTRLHLTFENVSDFSSQCFG